MSGIGYQRITIGTVIALITLIATVSGAVAIAVSNLQFSNDGNVHIENPLLLTNQTDGSIVTNIDWGTFFESETRYIILNLTNTGERDLTITLYDDAWTVNGTSVPKPECLNFGATQNNTSLAAKTWMSLELTLEFDGSLWELGVTDNTPFNFDVHIEGA